MSIEFQNITKDFGDTRALDHISLTLERNRIYGLLGNNGAGKTTFLSILTNRQLPTDGTVLVDGQTVQNNDEALGKVFMVGEQNLFPEDMKVFQAFNTAQLFYPQFDRVFAENIAKKFGLNLRKKISALSTGYASIFRLVLGLSVNVPYLAFDEPVLGLDAQNRELFYRLLLEKYAENPCTIIMSTHLIAEVAPLIEQTIIIRNGKILKNALTEDLTANAYAVSGPTSLVDAYSAGKHVLAVSMLGGLKTVSIQGHPDEALPQGLELTKLNLQDYFISLMEEEDKSCT
ncbi:MAG: ABC transporter ATP-binding protein [Clostridiaceae bacterium]|nr:ABC transporter ATP-binding protein [Clostridiaceae bacterium]